MPMKNRNCLVDVLILSMPEETESTLLTVGTLLEGLDTGVTISVLLNGGHDSRFRDLVSRSPAVRYYESPVNLGVAGGRNYLLNTPECRQAEIVMVLDNDVVPPLDYIRRLSVFLLEHEDSGIVGPIVMNFRGTAGPELPGISGPPGPLGNGIHRVLSADIKQLFMKDPSMARLFHAGIAADYRYAYFSIWSLCLTAAASLQRKLGAESLARSPILARHSQTLRMIRHGTDCYQVSTVAGGTQAFRRSMVDQLGGYDDLFNPYALEDADLCIRAMNAGFKNYIDCNTWILHGTDSRSGHRDEIGSLENRSRALSILASKVYPRTPTFAVLKLAGISLCLTLLKPGPGFNRLRAQLRGYRRGLRQVRQTGASA